METEIRYGKRTPHQHLIDETDGVVVTECEPHPAVRYKRTFMGLGITQVVVGVISAILGGVAMVPTISMTAFYPASGIWAGGWYITAGILAIATSVKPHNCNVIGGMVVAILTSLTSFGLTCFEATLAGVVSVALCDISETGLVEQNLCAPQAFTAIHATLGVLAFAEFVISIVHSSYCCCGVGCCGNNGQRQIVSTTVMRVPAVQPYMPVPQNSAYGNYSGQIQFQAQQVGSPPPIHSNQQQQVQAF